MTYSVYQHWDPLRTCVVGRSYPPEFYSWIKIPHVRNLFEKIAIETEEDYQKIITVLKNFGVKIFRPDLPKISDQSHFGPPPMNPRDNMIMIGDVLYQNWDFTWRHRYDEFKGPDWPQLCPERFDQLPKFVQHEMTEWFGCNQQYLYQNVIDHLQAQGNVVRSSPTAEINGAMVSRIGKDLYVGTDSYDKDQIKMLAELQPNFPDYRLHIVNSGGHGDGTYCPVCPGLIISLEDIPTYAETFPGWEVVYLPKQSWGKVTPFLDLKQKNKGKWWIPGFEYDQDVIDTVEIWLSRWVGYVEETVFDVNMLIIDPKNVIVFNYNEQVFKALSRYGITPHVVPFRHRYFWDGGIHCITLDLHREGTMQDYFLERNIHG